MKLLKRSRLVLPVAAALAALLLSAPAHASPGDDVAFLDQLNRDGVTFSDVDAALGYARSICAALDRGVPHLAVVDTVMLDNPQLDWDHATALTINAYLTYCPWHALPVSGSEPAPRLAYA